MLHCGHGVLRLTLPPGTPDVDLDVEIPEADREEPEDEDEDEDVAEPSS
ncbi:hypothetical protein GCM10027258_74420 [Amycolatopsis stemonae]